MKISTLTHQTEKKTGSAVLTSKVVTLFDGDKRFRFMHDNNDSIQDVKTFFYDWANERLFNGTIYDFISRCFLIEKENGGQLNFKARKLKVLNEKDRSGVGFEYPNEIEVEWSGQIHNLEDLLEDECI